LVVDDAETVTVTINGAEWRNTTFELDVCKDCRQTGGSFESMSLLDIANHGRVVHVQQPVAKKRRTDKSHQSSEDRWKDARRSDGVYVCPFVGCDNQYPSARKLGAHYGQAHTKKEGK
jgi:hypothetical protein